MLAAVQQSKEWRSFTYVEYTIYVFKSLSSYESSMSSKAFIISCVLHLIISINGLRYRAPCMSSTDLRCDDNVCIDKHKWCNNNNNCNDRSDENYCSLKSSIKGQKACNEDIHFKCKDGNMCIPREGVCDGYSSCSDMSDEMDCPCEELTEDEREFEYLAYIDAYRTQQKCWKIPVNSGQYLKLKVYASLHKRDCTEGNITIFKERGKYYHDEWKVYYDELTDIGRSVKLLCNGSSELKFESEYFEDALIRYSSNYYVSSARSNKDLIQISYIKADKLCLDQNSFKCSEFSCISPQKKCDGHKDCENGQDEQDCEYAAFSAAFNAATLANNRIKAIQWIKNQHNADWGWKDNTQRAVVALYLSQGANYNGSSQEEELFAKQLELEISTYLLRRITEKILPSELSAYISALLVICHDPRNFYGIDLVSLLKDMLETSSEYAPPFQYLTLCNADEHIPEDAVYFLLGLLENSPEHGFVLEVQALATMAISCIISKENIYAHLQQNITEALNDLKKEQKEDGSFGNEYTTALVLQALMAGNQEDAKDWSPKSALQYLSKRQQESGSFGDFLTTYLVLPILNEKTLVDIGRVNCTKSSRRPRDSNKVTDIKYRLGGKMVVKYSLYIGDDKDQIHPIVIRTPENITVHELMSLAVDIYPKYRFKTHEVKKKLYVYEILDIPNDPLSNKFWFIYKGVENGTTPFIEQSPDRITVFDQDHIIMWYKTLHPYR